MHFGNHTNTEIRQLIESGQVSVDDTVYSTTWAETLRYDGVVFKSVCNCRYVGKYPSCTNDEPPQGDCPGPLDIHGEFEDSWEPPEP